MAGPLEKLKVLDFSTLLPGPYATMCLADLGADVLQIMSGSRPDLADIFPPFIPGTRFPQLRPTCGATSAAWP